MVQPIKFKISGSDPETDAPTVDDLLAQIEDFFAILKGVEAAIDDKGGIALEWRITDASRNSPVGFEATPYARNFGVNVDEREAAVRHFAAEGLRTLSTGAERPRYFDDATLTRAKRMAQRVTAGLSLMEAEFGPGEPGLRLTPTTARDAVRNIELVLTPKARPYKEIGVVEGTYSGFDRDGFGRPILSLKMRLTGEPVKCILSGAAFEGVKDDRLEEVFSGKRLRVHGVLHYRGPGRLDRVEADDVRAVPSRENLPTVDDILDDDFTGGMSTEDYLKALRDGSLS